jgi:hypothetical protein
VLGEPGAQRRTVGEVLLGLPATELGAVDELDEELGVAIRLRRPNVLLGHRE